MDTDKTIKYINICFENIVDNKIRAFELSVIKNFNFEKKYELKTPVLCKHFIINAVKEINNNLALKNKNFRVDFDKDTCKYFIKLHHDYLKKQGCISDEEKIHLNKLYNDKCELNQVIKENTNDKELKMVPIVIHKYFGYPMYEITLS